MTNGVYQADVHRGRFWLAMPEPGSVSLPQPDALPPQTAELVERVRHHPAGRYALAMFAEHRRAAVT